MQNVFPYKVIRCVVNTFFQEDAKDSPGNIQQFKLKVLKNSIDIAEKYL